MIEEENITIYESEDSEKKYYVKVEEVGLEEPLVFSIAVLSDSVVISNEDSHLRLESRTEVDREENENLYERAARRVTREILEKYEVIKEIL